MTAFWIAAGLLTALVLALLGRPLLRAGGSAGASRKALNTAIFRDQMADLERDLASGTLIREDYAAARDELERRVLEDLGSPDLPVAARRRLPTSAVALGLALPAAAVALYLILGNPAALDPAVRKGGTPAPSVAEVEQMVAKLAAKLEKNPDNPEGWVMLGRSYKAMGRYAEAGQAFARAGAVMESEPVLMLEMAELSAEQNEGRIEGRALDLLQQVLKDQPDNPQALVLGGSNAFARKNYAAAVKYWESLLAQVAPDSEDAHNLATGIARARSMMGQGSKAPDAKTVATKAAAPTSATPAFVSGRVELAAALKAGAAPGDTVFIFARAVSGPRMPLAVQRAKVADLPMDFRLDDSMAMSPELKLSAAGELRIEARVSRSGNAIAAPGDLSGSLSPVKPGSSGLKIVIDETVR